MRSQSSGSFRILTYCGLLAALVVLFTQSVRSASPAAASPELEFQQTVKGVSSSLGQGTKKIISGIQRRQTQADLIVRITASKPKPGQSLVSSIKTKDAQKLHSLTGIYQDANGGELEIDDNGRVLSTWRFHSARGQLSGEIIFPHALRTVDYDIYTTSGYMSAWWVRGFYCRYPARLKARLSGDALDIVITTPYRVYENCSYIGAQQIPLGFTRVSSSRK